MHNDKNLINDKFDNFGIYMATKYEDDTDSFAYKENIINGKDKQWNVDTVIQAMNEGFKIIMEEEQNSQMENINKFHDIINIVLAIDRGLLLTTTA